METNEYMEGSLLNDPGKLLYNFLGSEGVMFWVIII